MKKLTWQNRNQLCSFERGLPVPVPVCAMLVEVRGMMVVVGYYSALINIHYFI